VLARTVRRIDRHLRRRGVLPGNEDDDLHADPETGLAAAAVSGEVPPAGRSGRSGSGHSSAGHPRTTSRCAPAWMASRSTRLRAQVRSTPPAERRCCATCYARPSLRTRSSRARTA
jgi:hypothetical protein